jgi:hypothetical protein
MKLRHALSSARARGGCAPVLPARDRARLAIVPVLFDGMSSMTLIR